jgi:hypothetical protein
MFKQIGGKKDLHPTFDVVLQGVPRVIILKQGNESVRIGQMRALSLVASQMGACAGV